MVADTVSTRPTPTAFISYSWDSEAHKEWVLRFATRLRADGVDVTLDQWHLHPGDQLPAFMERAIRENDYVLIVCTPHYAERSNRRAGGVGYEGDIMTAEFFNSRNERKFIPIFRSGQSWDSAAPSWLAAKYRIDLRGTPYREDQYSDGDLCTGTRQPRFHPPRHTTRTTAGGLEPFIELSAFFT
jgi:hypothetical protein